MKMCQESDVLSLQGIRLAAFIILATFKCGRAMLRDEPKLRPGTQQHKQHKQQKQQKSKSS